MVFITKSDDINALYTVYEDIIVEKGAFKEDPDYDEVLADQYRNHNEWETNKHYECSSYTENSWEELQNA